MYVYMLEPKPKLNCKSQLKPIKMFRHNLRPKIYYYEKPLSAPAPVTMSPGGSAPIASVIYLMQVEDAGEEAGNPLQDRCHGEGGRLQRQLGRKLLAGVARSHLSPIPSITISVRHTFGSGHQ